MQERRTRCHHRMLAAAAWAAGAARAAQNRLHHLAASDQRLWAGHLEGQWAADAAAVQRQSAPQPEPVAAQSWEQLSCGRSVGRARTRQPSVTVTEQASAHRGQAVRLSVLVASLRGGLRPSTVVGHACRLGFRAAPAAALPPLDATLAAPADQTAQEVEAEGRACSQHCLRPAVVQLEVRLREALGHASQVVARC